MVLPRGKDFVLRPWRHGRCQYRELKDGTLDLCDIAEMNDALDADAENQARARAAAERNR